MSDTNETPFTLGVTYWPRRAGFRWWSAVDRGEVREDLQRIAGLGCAAVRFCLRWEDVQPAPRKINTPALNAFEQALEYAGEAGLRVVAALFPAALGGALHVPRWAANPDPLDELMQLTHFGEPLVVQSATPTPVVYDGAYQTNLARDQFRDSGTIEAQRYLVYEVVGYFGSHPALMAWQLGEGLERIRKPESSQAIHEWYAKLAETAREGYSRARLLGVTSERGLTNTSGPRPEHIASTCDDIAVAADVPLPLPDLKPMDLDALEFLYTLTAGLAGRPVAVAGLGQPTAPDNRDTRVADSLYGRSISTYLASYEAQAEFVGQALERLWRAGAAGAWLAAYADYPPDEWRLPPLDRSIRSRTLGLVDAAGREKPVAAALREFAEQPRGNRRPSAIAPRSEALGPRLDSERYWRDPRRECERLWREWLAER